MRPIFFKIAAFKISGILMDNILSGLGTSEWENLSNSTYGYL